MNKNKLLRLRDFFHGGQVSNTTLDLVFNFEPVEVYTLKHQFPCLDLSTKERKAAELKLGYLMINGYLAPFADLFFNQIALNLFLLLSNAERE